MSMPPIAMKVERRLAELQHGRSRFRPARPSQLEDLRLRVREAATWCACHLDPSAIQASLRPSDLAPAPLASTRWDAVDDVVRARRHDFVNTRRWDQVDPRGRLLVYFPDANLFDGAAEVASGVFFDVHNAPPWGTWIGYFDDRGADQSFSSYLLSWVPATLVAAAGAGIEVNPERCIGWFADAALGLRSVLEPSQLWESGY